jgi:hypothetical protein
VELQKFSKEFCMMTLVILSSAHQVLAQAQDTAPLRVQSETTKELLSSLNKTPRELFQSQTSEDNGVTCQMIPPLVQAKISACELEMVAFDCKSLPRNIPKRNCHDEALHPAADTVQRFAGCLKGEFDATFEFVKSMVNAINPIRGIKENWSATAHDVRHYDSLVYDSCTKREKQIHQALVANQTPDPDDMEVVSKCKGRLLEEFPDLREKFYPGEKLNQASYDNVLDTVHARLDEIQSRQASLQKFLRDHPNDAGPAAMTSAQDLLNHLGAKLACYAPREQEALICAAEVAIIALATPAGRAAVLKIKELVAGGEALAETSLLSGAPATVTKLKDDTEGLSLYANAKRTRPAEEIAKASSGPAPPLEDIPIKNPPTAVVAKLKTQKQIRASLDGLLELPSNPARSAEVAKMDQVLVHDLSETVDSLPPNKRARMIRLLGETQKGQSFSERRPLYMGKAAGAVKFSPTENPYLLIRQMAEAHPLTRLVLKHEFSHLERLDAGNVSALKAYHHARAVVNRRLGVYREELKAFGDQYDFTRKLYQASDLPRLKELYPSIAPDQLTLLKRAGALTKINGSYRLDYTVIRKNPQLNDAMQDYTKGEMNDKFIGFVEDAVTMTKSQFTKAQVGRDDYINDQIAAIQRNSGTP